MRSCREIRASFTAAGAGCAGGFWAGRRRGRAGGRTGDCCGCRARGGAGARGCCGRGSRGGSPRRGWCPSRRGRICRGGRCLHQHTPTSRLLSQQLPIQGIIGSGPQMASQTAVVFRSPHGIASKICLMMAQIISRGTVQTGGADLRNAACWTCVPAGLRRRPGLRLQGRHHLQPASAHATSSSDLNRTATCYL